ncbi:FAD-dependent oxidoreductase [Streptomyces bauhiniae]|uniref:FAD-dependent oxidoreductase n=1 Tax=Streptomyces bauhiniae TaxID=2340725 RepID=UPI0034516B3E
MHGGQRTSLGHGRRVGEHLFAWGGWIALTPSWLPVAGEATKNVFYAVGCNGHGLAQAPYLGTLLADRIARRPPARGSRRGVAGAAPVCGIAGHQLACAVRRLAVRPAFRAARLHSGGAGLSGPPPARSRRCRPTWCRSTP